ncbi:hypothetical protein GIB67_031516 [Kingdonia uniflora]|uniref:Pentatricopeptide repeat-containing protein n=1 Tax=Kingdonia uniflora TaxID=39325 RepID=A0A7J7MN61_9MAGN|nr:hypothetical protein GIB67_031516 [Kingdonia uniflora]
METNGSIGPNLFIYNSLLGAVKQTEKYAEVEKIMEDIRVEGVCPNVVTYNTLMSIYVEQGHPRKALSVLEEILEKGLSPSPVSYSTALLCYRRMEGGNGALKFFLELGEIYQNGEIGKDTPEEDWVEEFVKFENFTIRNCNQVMRRWLIKRTPLTTDVLKLLMEMVQMDKAGLRSGRAEYEHLIWACTHEGHYTGAKELYNRIREHESEISLSVCNHVIWLMGKSKKWWAALEIYEHLLDKGPKPNNLSYELVVSHFNILLTSKTFAAVQVFKRMVEQGEKPTVISYGALLSALEKVDVMSAMDESASNDPNAAVSKKRQ